MAVVGVGVDVADVRRVTTALERTAGFGERVFSDAERTACAGDGQRLAARFAAKEAAAKALGVPAEGAFRDVEVVTAADGRPELLVTGAVAAAAARLGVRRWHISLSHDGGVAVAVVVAES